MAATERRNASLIVDRNIEAGRGERDAYVTPDESLTYEGLRRQANRMGRLLRELGVQREQRVLLVLDNTTAFPIAFLGALRIGAVPVPVSVRETPEHFRHFIEDSYARVVVCDADMLPILRAALAGHRVRFLAARAEGGAVELGGAIDLGDAIELGGALAAQEQELDAVATHPDDMAFWLYTSGSTGKPKGVVHLHRSIEVTSETFARQVLGIEEADRIFSTTKLYHAYGLGNCLSYSLHRGACSILLAGPPTPERLLSTLRERRPTVYCSVPALYRQLAGDPDADGAFDSVRLCISAAEPLPVRTFEQWRERFGLEIVDGIGCTEMVVAYCSNRPGEALPGTTGHPVPGYDLRLIDEAGNELEGPAVGTLEVRGGSRAAYYWHEHEQTKRSMRGEWFTSGDRFRRREDGAYEYVSRTDDMFKVGGLWVSPLDMEKALREHPAVAEAGVVGVSVGDYSRVAAFLTLDPGAIAGRALEDELRVWCKERLREYEYPHLIRFVDELPQTHNGKPQRFKLREAIELELAVDERRAGTLAHEHDDLSEDERARAMTELVLAQIAAVLGENAATIDTSRAFEELGLDSLTGVELRNRVASAVGLPLPSTLVFDHPTPAALATHLQLSLEGRAVPASGEAERGVGDAEHGRYLAHALDALERPAAAPRLPPASPGIRARTSPLLHRALPARLAVRRAARNARTMWRQSPDGHERALAAMRAVVAGTARAEDLPKLARAHFVESNVERALFWQHPWTAKVDALSALRLREALSERRGVLLSACHVGPYHRLHCAPPLKGRTTYLVPGAWFFDPPSHNYWGRRLARWRKGMGSVPVPAKGSFRIVQALLERGEPVFVFFDMPGPRQTRFLGKPATLAEGTAQLAVRADALVVPVRARRAGHVVWVDAAAPLDPRELSGVDELHDALAARHERWILENPAAMEDPHAIGWGEGARADAWTQP